MDLAEKLNESAEGGNLVLDLGWPLLPWEPSTEDRYGATGVLLTFLPSAACTCADCNAALSVELVP